MPVLDASAIINCFPFQFEEGKQYFTVPLVLDEFKDFRSRAVAQSGIDQGFLKVFSPSDESVSTVRKADGKNALSQADLEVLALAFEKKQELWTDDKALQRTARKLGVKCKPIIHGSA
jgi:UPF0271 protein